MYQAIVYAYNETEFTMNFEFSTLGEELIHRYNLKTVVLDKKKFTLQPKESKNQIVERMTFSIQVPQNTRDAVSVHYSAYTLVRLLRGPATEERGERAPAEVQHGDRDREDSQECLEVTGIIHVETAETYTPRLTPLSSAPPYSSAAPTRPHSSRRPDTCQLSVGGPGGKRAMVGRWYLGVV